MKNILVIGNGFDLSHGLKTGYKDFVARVEEAFAKEAASRDTVDEKLTRLCNVNGFFRHFHFSEAADGSWTFFEEETERIVRALVRFADVMEVNRRDPEFEIQEYNLIAGLYTYEELQIYKHFARIFAQSIEDTTGGIYKLRVAYITAERTLNRRAYLDEVRRELDDFTAALDLYLTTVCEAVPEETASALMKETPDYVINFNYTDTVRRYGVPEERIYYAKGRAGTEPVSLVLGCPDRHPGPHGTRHPVPDVPPMSPAPGMPPAPGMSPMPPVPGMPPMPGCPGGFHGHEEWLPFCCDFQKLTKGIGLPDRTQLHPDDGSAVTVRYFGYSFPEGDAGLLGELFEIASQSIIFCVDREDYARKLLSLMRLFGKERTTDRIYAEKLIFEII